MTLIERAEFKSIIQKEKRIQIPRLIRWKFKMESNQTLAVDIHLEGNWESREKFYANMRLMDE